MRRILGSTGAAALVILIASCGSDPPTFSTDGIDDDVFVNSKVLGVCFMDGSDCVSTYVDLGPYDDLRPVSKLEMIPAYIFPAISKNQGGQANPLDPSGLYNAYRLQNNVFGSDGRVWEMFLIQSAGLTLMATPEPGKRIWGAGADTTSTRTRDLRFWPITSEEEVLRLVDTGDLRIIKTGLFTDCPLEVAKSGDIVVNLNPQVPVCSH